ncbi:ribosomal L1 domain-containing protein 1-like [Actinia tenebrosa]|uniref:Ribosomal L1 domain-containing protein 1 n=1 Tax=Actinia tenebrosa TaxID=6105 RepID=A0A6P8IRK3_ACTTE|nr:ribosomal L1 domain-containing protein 1-like [Actinia tenebrosa]
MADKVKVVRESVLSQKQVDLAVSALMKHVQEKEKSKPSLLGDQQVLWLILALKKIPAPDKKPKRIAISNSLHPDDSDVCLITKSEGKPVKELLQSAGVTSVKKVISLTKLKKNYKSYESKRQLASLYDLFICDDVIYHLLPKFLGKAFYTRKKFPIPVSLKKKDLKGEINKVLQSTYMSLGHGSCSAIKIGHTGLTEEEVTANIMETAKGIANIIPRGWKNIKSLNIKTSNSVSLPIYNSLPERPVAIQSESVKKPKATIKEKKQKKRKVNEKENESDSEVEES